MHFKQVTKCDSQNCHGAHADPPIPPLRRPEGSGGTAIGPSDSGPRSQDDEVHAARKEMKSNREKLLRDRMNDHFAELAGVLGKPYVLWERKH